MRNLILKYGLRSILPVILVLLIFPVNTVFGDVVYVKDGREIKGQATEKDGKVVITLPDGKTVTIDKNQVLHIARGNAKGKTEDKKKQNGDNVQTPVAPTPPIVEKTPPAAPAPPVVEKVPPAAPAPPVVEKAPPAVPAPPVVEKAPPAAPAPPVVEKAPSAAPAPPVVEKAPPAAPVAPVPPVVEQAPPKTQPPVIDSHEMIEVIKIKDAARPESFLYMWLRRSLDGSDTIKKQITIYRMLAHDRKRKIGKKWFSPSDFTRRRKAFVGHLKAAQEKFREAKKFDKKEDAGSKKKRKGFFAAGNRDLAQASQSWADPVLRKFLLGLTKLHEGNDAGAESYFRECISKIPHIAGFHQARGQALLNLKRDDDALRENIIVLKLMPNSRDALGILQLVMKKISGSTSQGQAYKDARAMVRQYVKPAVYNPKKKSTTWLFPGKKMRNDSTPLPVLSFDRIELRQGIAVPVSHNVLAVDIGVVSGAEEVFLRAGSQIIPGRIDHHSLKPGSLIAFVYFYECKFTPIKLLGADQFQPKLQGIAYTTNIFREMGGKVRPFPVTVMKVDGENVILSAGVAPGEGGGPVIDAQGQLLGFLAGKIDPEEEKFPEKFSSVLQLGAAIEKIIKRKSNPPWRGKRNVKIVPISDKTFLIEALSYESFEDYAKKK